MLSHLAKTFAEMAARFESDYIFCWLAWDGDNILTNGGIIDYGSIRQFGLFHYEYRFDDVERWSTNLLEQKDQARYIVQTFAQIVDFINTGKKKPLNKFRKHIELRRFNSIFQETKTRLLLEKTGFTTNEAQDLMRDHGRLVDSYQKAFTWFERKTKATAKPYRVADAVTKDALYCMRDILRELPQYYRQTGGAMSGGTFMRTIASSYCSKKDASTTLQRSVWAQRFQSAWFGLVEKSAHRLKISTEQKLEQMCTRSAVINRYERVTGDAICHVGEKLLRGKKHLSRREVHQIMNQFIEEQVLLPEVRKTTVSFRDNWKIQGRQADSFKCFKTVKAMREGL